MKHLVLTFLLLAAPAATPVMGSGVPHGAMAEAVDLRGPEGLRYLGTGSFGAHRRAITARLGGEDPAGALLDLASLYLARGMAVEGLSTIEAVPAADLPEGAAAWRDAVQAALYLLDARPRPLPEGALAALNRSHVAGLAPLAALAAGREAGARVGSAQMASALSGLSDLPPELALKVMPLTLRLALDAGDWPLLAELAARYSDDARMKDASAVQYVIGRLAAGQGNNRAALKYYEAAGVVQDEWGHAARLAIVDMAAALKAVPPEDRIAELWTIYGRWRGDSASAETLIRIADTAVEKGDSPAALEALAEQLRQDPAGPAASAARARAQSLIGEFYRRGAAGEIGLGEFYPAHLRIAENFRFLPGFAAATTGLADRFLAIGAPGLAAEEYRMSRDFLEAGDELGIQAAAAATLDDLMLREAAALVASGQLETARALLVTPLRAGGEEAQRRQGDLKARLFELTGVPVGPVDGKGAGDGDEYTRLIAREYYARQDWPRALEAYRKLWKQAGDDIPLRDAIGLLLSAHRSGDGETATAISVVLAQRPDSPGEDIAGSLSGEDRSLLKLKSKDIEKRLTRSEKTAEAAAQMVDLNSENGASDVARKP